MTVCYERFTKVCPQCNTIVHMKRSVCDLAMPSHQSLKGKAWCATVGEPENAMKHRKALLSEEVISDKRERRSPQSK